MAGPEACRGGRVTGEAGLRERRLQREGGQAGAPERAEHQSEQRLFAGKKSRWLKLAAVLEVSLAAGILKTQDVCVGVLGGLLSSKFNKGTGGAWPEVAFA